MKQLFFISLLVWVTSVITAQSKKPDGEVLIHEQFIASARYQFTLLAHQEAEVYLKFIPSKADGLQVLISGKKPDGTYANSNRKSKIPVRLLTDGKEVYTITICSEKDPALLVRLRKLFQQLQRQWLLVLKLFRLQDILFFPI